MQFIKKQTGFTFIEVLLSLFLLNVFLCGLIRTELFSIQTSSESYLKTIAIIQAKNLLALLKLQKNTGVSISTILSQWQQETKNVLPMPKSHYSCNQIQCQVILEWQFKRKQRVYLNEKI